MVIKDEDKERIRLAETDLAQTNDFIKGVLATSAAIRGSAITIWLALLGFAVQQNLAALGLLATIVTLVFLLVDGYHGWLYSEASKHAYAAEHLLSKYYDALSRADDDPEEMVIFLRDLRAHRFGLFHNLPRGFKPKHFLEARPALFYKVLYPLLILVAITFWGLLGFHVTGKGTPAPTHVIIDHAAADGSTGAAGRCAKSFCLVRDCIEPWGRSGRSAKSFPQVNGGATSCGPTPVRCPVQQRRWSARWTPE